MSAPGTLLTKIWRKTRRIGNRLFESAPDDDEQYPWRDIFSIALLKGDSPFDLLKPPATRPDPIIERRHVSDDEAIYVADPFLLRTADSWSLFFETLAKDPDIPGGQKGVIGLATSKDGDDWAYQGTIIREPYHLSYPHVFEWQGEFYMVPESNAARAVRLYRATRFPDQWEFAQNLLEDGEFNDATPFFYQNKWWMFSSSGSPPLHSDTLRLHCADNLTGPWSEHPSSPVVEGDRWKARPAGRVIEVDGALYRFAQQCEPNYGTLVRAFEIVELTPGSYREREITESPVLKPSGEGWNATGMHHIDAQQLEDGSWIAVVDGWAYGKAYPY